MSTPPEDKASALRRQAEAAVARMAAPVRPGATPDDTVHELLVHQVELEMQNEELRRLQASIDAERARYFELFDLAQYFEFIGADDLVGTRASKTKVIAHVLVNTGLDPTTQRLTMVGDRRHDVEGAAAHGIDTLGVLWGYGDHEELTSAGAHRIVATPADLTAVLNSPASRT